MINIPALYNNLYQARQKTFSIFSFLFNFLYIRVYTIIIITLNCLTWIAVFYMVSVASQDLVILHYNVNFGVDFIGSVKKIFTLPILAALIILINYSLLISLADHKNFRFISHVILGATLFVSLFLIISLAPIYLINFR